VPLLACPRGSQEAGLGIASAFLLESLNTKTAEQLDLQALHRVRARLVGQRTGIVNQIRAFLLERGVAVRKGPRFLRTELPRILATRCDVLSPRMVHVIEELRG
jgi:transposase